MEIELDVALVERLQQRVDDGSYPNIEAVIQAAMDELIAYEECRSSAQASAEQPRGNAVDSDANS